MQRLSRFVSGGAELSRDVRVLIASQADVERVRWATRDLSSTVGFDREDAEMIVLAVSELATNLLRYAHQGEIVVTVLGGEHDGIQVESRDAGPGIADIQQAMQNGYSTGGGLGSGLPAVRRLMDDLEIVSNSDGTTIIARKWLPNL